MSVRGNQPPEIRLESPHYDNDYQWRWKVVDGFGEAFASGESKDHDVAYPAAVAKLNEIRIIDGWGELQAPDGTNFG
jgi:hypothetical protein